MPFAIPLEVPNPWGPFLTEVDAQLSLDVAIHCLGGFVTALYYDLPRPTNDLDYIEAIPNEAITTLQRLAGADSSVARKYGVHFQHVAVASVPESYEDRLAELWPRRFQHLRLFALEAHDLALSKLARNSPSDRNDFAQLATTVPLDPRVLRARYEDELRPIIIGDPEQHDRTLELWMEAYCCR